MIKHELNFKDKERQNLKDKFSEKNGVNGLVRIYEKKIEGTDKKLYLIHQTTNLVVYHGRAWLAQRAFNSNADTSNLLEYDLNEDGVFDMYDVTFLFNKIFEGDTDINEHPTWDINEDGVIDVSDVTQLQEELAGEYKSMFISWLAIGTGGCVSGHPLTPSAPDLRNIGLSSHGVIDSGMRYVTVDGLQYHKFDEGFPDFQDDAEISSVGLGNSNDRKLMVKTSTTLTADEANNDGGIVDDDAYQEINEAGLFVAGVDTISPAPTEMEMFARVTFPTIKKNNQVELVFNWYIFF